MQAQASKMPLLKRDLPTQMATVVFAMFVTEFLLLTWVKPNYSFSFFFWLDALAAISLIREYTSPQPCPSFSSPHQPLGCRLA